MKIKKRKETINSLDLKQEYVLMAFNIYSVYLFLLQFTEKIKDTIKIYNSGYTELVKRISTFDY